MESKAHIRFNTDLGSNSLTANSFATICSIASSYILLGYFFLLGRYPVQRGGYYQSNSMTCGYRVYSMKTGVLYRIRGDDCCSCSKIQGVSSNSLKRYQSVSSIFTCAPPRLSRLTFRFVSPFIAGSSVEERPDLSGKDVGSIPALPT